jgi:hypothetical protein
MKVNIFPTMINEGMVNFEALKNYLKENLILEKHISFKNLTSICSIHAISLRLYDTPIVDVQ